MTNRRAVFLLLSLALVASAVCWALGSDKAMYAGGTVAGLPEKTEGRIDATNTDNMIFRADKNNATMAIPWATVQAIEYGQRVSRRWKTAIFLTPWALFSKGRKHYVTITYKDSASNDQAAVFEFGKEVFRPYLAALKAKSGKEVTCQDEEARKYMGGTCALAAAEQSDSPKKEK